MIWFNTFQSPFCGFTTLGLVGDKHGLQALKLLKENEPFKTENHWHRNPDFFRNVQQQLIAYAKGDLQSFDVPLNPQGTQFQKNVWQALQTIPYGKTVTYQQIAEQIGKPKSYRPVGNANNKNPIPIIIPCHRVTPKNGNLGGYAYGKGLKAQLLELESNHLND
ncbi:methylated-DNA--[protein]-cysteine S-methyltransferase [Thiomicrorhabdus indica]|uniref:methylated-DNA--[protein]-cysteine S-methyltransferase n=1 Tax=Thiomicrorhabdus indica TaxID=2267253 RepID=UPI002AA85E4D|nr:methylated-DNA--[protein]-cysteine S-methyltransferase [Thiomicrorhabdus indica]